MKPHRLTLTNALVMGYGLDKQIHNIYDPRPATQEELEMYHDHDYVEFLSRHEILFFFFLMTKLLMNHQSHPPKPSAK